MKTISGFFALSLALAAACGSPSPTATQSPTSAVVDPETDAALTASLAQPDRTEKERMRDAYRHPKETLEFFGLRKDMTVVELWAGGGWYSKVLAPVLADKGTFIATGYDASGSGEEAEFGKAIDARFKNDKAFAKAQLHVMHPSKGDFNMGPDGSADLVLTFRNIHNWMEDGIADKVFAAAFAVLKKGGTFGVVEHRAKADADPEKVFKSGYVREDAVIAMAQKAGFVLAARSEINANPKDTKDYPKGVWTLPPAYANGEVDKDKYAAIGESDRMTLKFQKP